MKITIGVPVLNQFELTLEFLKKLLSSTKSATELCNKSLEIILVDNGSISSLEEFLRNKCPELFNNNLQIIRNATNIGVRESLNQIWNQSSGDVIVYTHNDVMFYEQGWDSKIRIAFADNPEAGIVGAYGAKGIGTSNIYEAPYEMNQLARNGNVSNGRMDQSIHGFRNLKRKYENVAVFDGYFLAIKKELLDKTKGFSDILPQHHNYDNLICVQSLENGYENIVVGLDLDHLGGRTDVGENWSEKFGKSKQDIHIEAHPPFYKYCKGLLPVLVEDVYNEDSEIIGYQLFMDRKLKKTKIYE